MTIIDGKELAGKIKGQVKEKVVELVNKGIIPKLAIIRVGNDDASIVYIKNKIKACDEVGIKYEEIVLGNNIKIDNLISKIKELNNRKDIHGILVQSPLPNGLDYCEVIKKVDYRKDVDGLHPLNVGLLEYNKELFIPCTAYGIIKIFEEYNINLEGKNAVIIGRSNIVAKPLAQCLINRNATVTICNSKTKDLSEITKKADILISAVGKTKFITENMIKENAVIIDVGINRVNNQIVGDVDFENVKNKASYITPVPGGVGPLTVAMLLSNVIKLAELLNGNIE